MMNPIQLVLISGMGGAGKTTALHTLEDLGFYCVDNLPLVLLTRLLDLLDAHPEIRRVAIGVDVRDSLFLPLAPKVIENLAAKGLAPEIVFLDAENKVLMRRYKETRRSHPLDKSGRGLNNAIERERRILRVLHPYIQTRIDTSALSPHQLRDLIRSRYSIETPEMRVAVVSFGYKYGILLDADIVFDVRFLKNPYFVPELSKLTGLDKPVADYVLSDPDSEQFLAQVGALLKFLVPRYQKEGKRYLTIGIGCTGGQHRSVTLAEEIYKRFGNKSWAVQHREIRN
ncbi:MAG: RNase adapter RapZ [Proteobacteria bacterium]|nr:RNase adapter RapZ [Pseudomonadota bacterium]MBQ4359067.1 RNase adapter RapZ [Pseudomonadota bacterium]